MKDEIRRQTGLIVRKDGEYLIGRNIFSDQLRWGSSLWDAWRTRDMGAARRVAAKVGGQVVLFNPVNGQRREIG